jgi:8-oxo-dGTP pyrophosphatase MutT (NUDIX family)
MSVKVQSFGDRRSRGVRQGSRGAPSSVPVVRFPELKKLQLCEQAAAVCYRLNGGGEIEFLLVRTRGTGRWTFPKGSAERGLTHAQVAALEAFEEAGVHGRIEQTAFACYAGRKRDAVKRSSTQPAEQRLKVSAYLCEVLGLIKPKEQNRNRTWFSAAEAREKLREGRTSGNGAQFGRVIDKAVARLGKLQREADISSVVSSEIYAVENTTQQPDALRRVRFEATEIFACDRQEFMRLKTSQRFDTVPQSASSGFTRSRKLLQLNSPQLTLAPGPGQKPHEGRKGRALA